MDTDTPQPRGIDHSTVDDGLRFLITNGRHELARDLLLAARQRAFLALGSGKTPNASTRAAAVDALGLVVHLCAHLIPRLIDDYLERRALDPE